MISNIEAILEAGGATLADVVQATVHLLDETEFPRFNAVYARRFPEPRPGADDRRERPAPGARDAGRDQRHRLRRRLRHGGRRIVSMLTGKARDHHRRRERHGPRRGHPLRGRGGARRADRPVDEAAAARASRPRSRRRGGEALVLPRRRARARTRWPRRVERGGVGLGRARRDRRQRRRAAGRPGRPRRPARARGVAAHDRHQPDRGVPDVQARHPRAARRRRRRRRLHLLARRASTASRRATTPTARARRASTGSCA